MEVVAIRESGITKRYEFLTDDDYSVKAAYIQRPEKIIICLSTQIGCVGKCVFCSAGNKELIRNITDLEKSQILD